MLKLLSRLSKRERVIAYSLLTAVFIMLFDRSVISPITKKLESLNEQIAAQEKKLIRTVHILQQEEAITGQYDELTGKIKQAGSDEAVMIGFQSVIEKLASKAKVSINNMQPSEPEKGDIYKRYAVRIDAEATIAHLTDFIYQIERDHQLIRVSEFSLAPLRGNPAILKANMLVTTVRLSAGQKQV